MKCDNFFFLNYSYTLLLTVSISYSSMAKGFLCLEEINWKEEEMWCAVVMILVTKRDTLRDRNMMVFLLVNKRQLKDLHNTPIETKIPKKVISRAAKVPWLSGRPGVVK